MKCSFLSTKFEVMIEGRLNLVGDFSPKLFYRQRKRRRRCWKAVLKGCGGLVVGGSALLPRCSRFDSPTLHYTRDQISLNQHFTSGCHVQQCVSSAYPEWQRKVFLWSSVLSSTVHRSSRGHLPSKIKEFQLEEICEMSGLSHRDRSEPSTFHLYGATHPGNLCGSEGRNHLSLGVYTVRFFISEFHIWVWVSNSERTMEAESDVLVVHTIGVSGMKTSPLRC